MVEAYIARIKECNPILNFMVADRFNEALEEAKKIDEILDSGDVPNKYSEKNAPYLGVPLSVKEAFAVVGKNIFLHINISEKVTPPHSITFNFVTIFCIIIVIIY